MSLQEKNKYEINTGQWKSPADVITTLCDFLRSWPAVKMLIDPLQRNVRTECMCACQVADIDQKTV